MTASSIPRRRDVNRKTGTTNLTESTANSVFWTANTRGSNVRSPTPTLVVQSASTTMKSFEMGHPSSGIELDEFEVEDLDLSMRGAEGWDSDEDSMMPISRKGRKEIERKGKEERKRVEKARKEFQVMEKPTLRLAKEVEDDTFSLSTLKMQIGQIGLRKNVSPLFSIFNCAFSHFFSQSDPSEAEEQAAQLLKMRNEASGLLNAAPQLKKKRSKFRLCGFFRSGNDSISSSDSLPKSSSTPPLSIVARTTEPHHLPTSFRSQSSLDSSRTLFHSPSDLPIKPTQVYASPIHPASTFIDISDLAGIVNDLPPTKRPHQTKRGVEQSTYKATRVDSWRKDCVIEEEVMEIGKSHEGGALGGLFAEHRGSVSKEYQAKRNAMARREAGGGEIDGGDVVRFTREVAGRRRNEAHPPPPVPLPQAISFDGPTTPPMAYTRRGTPSPTPSLAAKRRHFPPQSAPPASVLPSLPSVDSVRSAGENERLPLPSTFHDSFTPSTEYRFPSPVPSHGVIPLRYDTTMNRTPTRLVRHAINSSFESTQSIPALDSPPFTRRDGHSSSISSSEIASPLTENEMDYNSIGFIRSYSPTRSAIIHPFPRPPPLKQQPHRPSFTPTASARSTTSSSNFNFSVKDEDLFFSQPKAIYERAQRIAEEAGLDAEDGTRTTYQRANRQVPSLVKTSSLSRKNTAESGGGGRVVEGRGMGEASAIRRAMVTARTGQK